MPPPPQAPPRQEPALLASVITVLAAGITVTGITSALSGSLRAAGVGHRALTAVASLMLSWPGDVLEGTGPAARWAVRTNALRRAQFFMSACKRVQAAVVAARSRSDPVREAVSMAVATERGYLAQQAAMNHQRVAAATRTDGAAGEHGNLLGWNAVRDARCTPECRAAGGKNFRADRPPLIGYPGASHPGCRCYPSKPFTDAPVLP